MVSSSLEQNSRCNSIRGTIHRSKHPGNPRGTNCDFKAMGQLLALELGRSSEVWWIEHLQCPVLQATSVGQAVAGVAVSVLSFCTTWAAPVPRGGQEKGPADIAGTAFAYFGLSAAVIVASGAGYWMLQFLPFWLHHTYSHSGHSKPLLRPLRIRECIQSPKLSPCPNQKRQCYS